jgi:hypothetical protein
MLSIYLWSARSILISKAISLLMSSTHRVLLSNVGSTPFAPLYVVLVSVAIVWGQTWNFNASMSSCLGSAGSVNPTMLAQLFAYGHVPLSEVLIRSVLKRHTFVLLIFLRSPLWSLPGPLLCRMLLHDPLITILHRRSYLLMLVGWFSFFLLWGPTSFSYLLRLLLESRSPIVYCYKKLLDMRTGAPTPSSETLHPS